MEEVYLFLLLLSRNMQNMQPLERFLLLKINRNKKNSTPLKTPLPCLAHDEVSKRGHSFGILQLFRVDEIGVELRGV